MSIRVTNSAFKDLENIKEYYAEQGVPDIGTKFISEILDHIETLNENPEIGRLVPEFDDKSIREIIHPPFRAIYLLGESSISLIRVWRSERLLKLPENYF